MKTLFTGATFWHSTPTPAFLPGELLVTDGIITERGAPGSLDRTDATVIDLGGALVAPGLVDIHTHGRAGSDFISADLEALDRMSLSYLAAGTTTVMPSLASAPVEDYAAAAERIATAAAVSSGARLIGLHLEGRYLNPAKRGAHGASLLAPLDAAELDELHRCMSQPFIRRGLDPIFRLTAALELDTDGSFTKTAQERGILLSLGHTTASYHEATHAIDQGLASFSHLFNAMPTLHHREGGAVVACLDAAAKGKEVFGELICDGLHIAPEMIRLAYRLLGYDHTLLVTDSMEGTGCPDGDYTIAGERVILKDGRAVTESGALAGSTLSLLTAVFNLSDMCDIPLAQAIACATVNPARLLGLADKIGTLEVGAFADLLVLDRDGRSLRTVYLGGREVKTA